MKTCLCLMVLGLIALPAYSQEVELSKPGEIVIAPRGPKERGGLPFFSEDGLMGTRDRNVIIGAATGYDKGEELLQYGNWYGPGWWGGGKDAAHAGDRKPVDSLDAAAMRHDFAYQLAEQQGRIHGLKEEQRLKAMADMIAVKETLQLDADPSKWPQPPSDPEKANRYRDRIISGFDYTSGARDGTATVMNATDWVTSPLINYEMDTSNQYDEEQLKRSVGILANNWAKNHPNATADDATVEQQEQRSQEEQKRAVAEAKAQARRDEEDRKVDPTGTKEFSLEKKMNLPEDFDTPRNRRHSSKGEAETKKPSDEGKEAMKPAAAGEKPAETDPPPPDATIPVIPVDCAIEASIWNNKAPSQKTHLTFQVLDGKVTSSSTHNLADNVVVHLIFHGTIQDNVITGHMTTNVDPIRNGENTSYTHFESDDRITLHRNGSLSIEGTSHGTWRVVTNGKSVSGSNTENIKSQGRWSLKSKADK